MHRRLVPATMLALLLVTSGCAGLSSLGDAPSGGEDSSRTASSTDACTEQEVAYDVSVPQKPSELNKARARALVKDFEKRNKLARIRAEHENVTIDSTSFRESATKQVEGGYTVIVNLAVHYSTDRLTAKGGYNQTYRVTERRFERNGRTLNCW